MAARERKKVDEPSAPLWVVTYGDMMSLLLTFFILLLSFSTVSGNDFEKAMASLQGAFQQLRAALAQLERFSYRETPHLQELCAPFLDRAHRPSAYLGNVNRILAAMGLRTNPVLGLLLNAVVPWDFYFAHRLARVKLELARRAPAWMEVWFELEALGSLANLAYLHPEYTMPLLQEGGEEGRPVFAARGLGHPLLPASKVRNDFSVVALGQVGILTGSNMAGKSVFMKTVGANLALAQAGGPVDAVALESLPFRLFTSMGIADSVTGGISYFYAEVRRLKALLTELQRPSPLPLFYFVDEILRGTNNRERRIGSRVYRSGDRVMQIRNNYDKDVYNGDMGRITVIDLELHQVRAVFDGREVGAAGLRFFEHLQALADHNIAIYGLAAEQADPADADGADTVCRGGVVS